MGQINIESPCKENWGRMQLRSDGRWCLNCEKTVVDFTKMSDQEIRTYIEQHNSNGQCGHFRSDQVDVRDEKPNRFRWLKISLLFLFGISFLSSCYRKTQGCYAYYPEKHPDKKAKQELKTDSLHEQKLR